MVTILLNQSNTDSWVVRRCKITLFSDLKLGPAINLAREIARDEHQRMGREVCVQMPGPTSMIVLAHYMNDDAQGVAAAMAA